MGGHTGRTHGVGQEEGEGGGEKWLDPGHQNSQYIQLRWGANQAKGCWWDRKKEQYSTRFFFHLSFL